MQANVLKWVLNFYPPYLFTGIIVRKISADYHQARVEMGLHWYNGNFFRTQFGGSLYAMVDPLYALMLYHILGKEYIVWDQAAKIEFIQPGRGRVFAGFKISKEEIEEIRHKTQSGEKYLHTFPVIIRDQSNAPVARVAKTIYIRRKAKKQE